MRNLIPVVLGSLVLALAPTPSHGVQQIDQAQAQPVTEPGIQFVPATPFTWSTSAAYTGPVSIPVGPGGGWFVTPQGQWRLATSFTPDPTFEVILFPPYSGHPTAAERFLVQVPVGPAGGFPKAKALVLGFHAASLSEKNVFQGTSLPTLCYERGWMLLAPYGLSEFNFANVNSQKAVDRVLEVVATVFPFNEKRIYAVGFSMGGMSAVSWAMRHLDRGRFRAAGVIDHTGTMDAVATYNSASSSLKSILANSLHFGGSPATKLFEYDRVSPIRLLGGVANPNKAPVTNIRHLPFFVHYNLGDPNAALLAQTEALVDWLQGQGANVMVDVVSVPGTHWWSTLDMDWALNWMGRHELQPDPDAIEVFADDEVPYLYSEVRDMLPAVTTRYEVALGSGNQFSVFNTQSLRTLVLDLPAMGLDAGSRLSFDADSMDGTTDVIVLRGYASPPSAVTEDGLPAFWTHYPNRKELAITPTAAPAFFTVSP